MTIIAFDVGKLELVGVRADKNGAAKERFNVPNQSSGIIRFLQYLKIAYPDALVGSEAMAEYHRELAMQSMALGFTFKLLNPILTKQFTRHTIRKKKTDRTDAEIIAKLLAQGEGTVLSDSSLSVFKSLNRQANALTQLKKTLNAENRHLAMICSQSGVIANVDLDRIARSLKQRGNQLAQPGQRQFGSEPQNPALHHSRSREHSGLQFHYGNRGCASLQKQQGFDCLCRARSQSQTERHQP